MLLRKMHTNQGIYSCLRKAGKDILGPLGSAGHIHKYLSGFIIWLAKNSFWPGLIGRCFSVLRNFIEQAEDISDLLWLILINKRFKVPRHKVIRRGMYGHKRHIQQPRRINRTRMI